MQRKLIKQGMGGLTMYLPKKWLDKKGLREGDLVNISQFDSSLIIQSNSKKNAEIKLIITKDNVHHLRHILTHSYRRGFNKIIIEVESKETFKQIKVIVKEVLLGFEVTSIDKKRMVIENISEPSSEKYEIMLRKVFLIIQETQSLIKEKYSRKELDELRDQNDKFILFCKRLLMKERYTKNIILEWELLTFLMHIQHAYYYLADYMLKKKVSLSKNALSYVENLDYQVQLFRKAYYEKKKEYVYDINKLKKEYQFGKLIEKLEKSKGVESVVLSYIKEIFRIVQLATSPVLALSLQK